jgi:predicted RNase H-like HicB family nuclease
LNRKCFDSDKTKSRVLEKQTLQLCGWPSLLAFPERCTFAFMATYRVALRRSEEGYSVSCPGLPGCWSQGATEEEALANIRIAIHEYVEAAEELAREDDGRMVEVAIA